jgi:putative mRNA 3-end processing factor
LSNLSSIVEVSESGIVVSNKGQRVLLDPRRESKADVMFFSHAHSDHLMTTGKKNIACARDVLASEATTRLARVRGNALSLASCKDCFDGYDLIDTCHVLGSRGLLIDHQIYYTADISTRQRGFMGSARIPRADTLIVESTFGIPRYVFPPVYDVVHTTNKIIGEMFDRGVSVILMGYPLGKAQLLIQLFQHWAPLYIHDSVEKINHVYRHFGIRLKEGTVISNVKQNFLLEKSAPWLMILPLGAARSGYVKTIKERYRAVTIGFSGWAMDKAYRFMMGLDYALPLSDHCDYRELVRLVLASRARKVYTIHGFSAEFALSLRGMGIDAEPLRRRHKSQQPDNQIQKNSSLDYYF